MAKIITDITVVDSENDWVEVLHLDGEELLPRPITAQGVEQHMHREFIQGQRFRTSRQGEVVIGWCKELAELLDVPMEVYDQQQAHLSSARETLQQLETKHRSLTEEHKTLLYAVEHTTRWEHFKAIFRFK